MIIIGTVFVLVAVTLSAAQTTLMPSPCNIQCETITASQCTSSLTYTLTGFPNLFDHPNSMEANINAAYIDGAVTGSQNCYPQTREILCGTLYPECRPNEGLVFPSREMCNAFFTACAIYTPYLGQVGFDIDCQSQFQEEPVVPICPPTPPTSPPTTSKIPTTMGEKMNMTTVVDGNGKQKCPDESKECAGVSINSKTPGLFLLCLVILHKTLL